MIRLFLILLLLCAPAWAQSAAPRTRQSFRVSPGLEAAVWAAEPMVVNPTNIDIDERGRIWYLEAVNYRRRLKNLPDLRKQGDAIVILEDSDGDGRADKRKIFHQDPALRSPLGIAVLGDKVYISQSPDLVVYTKDENDKIIRREVLLSGFGGSDHDHGLHAVLFGHDGRLYFNAGDQGFDLTNKEGAVMASCRTCQYFAGTIWRMNADGSRAAILAHNFRNPYELALDSFGGIWQSDNDDDGNAWTRLNYIFEGGNYGYWGPGGRRWQEDKGTHFHQENPGVVPNIARLGAGSPAGLVMYEGKLLPEKYRGALFHAEAGKRALNAYLLSPDGAGYKTEVEQVIAGADTWFRPVDVAVGPDGALYVADWYDPSVGGHNMGDTSRGRIYRVAPVGFQAAKAPLDWESPSGLADALASPAQSIRYLAWTKLKSMGEAARPVLTEMWRSGDPVRRARALWLLGADEAKQALSSPDANTRVLALRVIAAAGGDVPGAAARLASDPSVQVRREAALHLRDVPAEGSLPLLVPLAKSWDGLDRWYLEALGIGFTGKESAAYPLLRDAVSGEKFTRLMWRLRPPEALPHLIAAAKSAGQAAVEAVGAYASPEAAGAVASLAGTNEQAFDLMARRLFSEWSSLRSSTPVRNAVATALSSPQLRTKAVDLADELEDAAYAPALLAMTRQSDIDEPLRARALQAAARSRVPDALPELESNLKSGSEAMKVAAVRGFGVFRPEDLNARMQRLLLSREPNAVRAEALRVLARSPEGLSAILTLEQKRQLPVEFRTLAATLVYSARNPAIEARAKKILPPIASKNATALPPPRVLARLDGDAAKGKRVFSLKTGADCASCHEVAPGRNSLGPNLAGIGTKLGKEALYDAIINPSAGVAHEYVAWVLTTRTQGQVIGILAEDTPQRVVVKTESGEEIRLKPGDITARRQSRLSLMPEDLVNRMTEQELVDLVEYLTTLRHEQQAAR
jgi:putative membrane-bound dehydrogenase-like protein